MTHTPDPDPDQWWLDLLDQVMGEIDGKLDVERRRQAEDAADSGNPPDPTYPNHHTRVERDP
jgi:hypothetical protein